MIGQQFGIQTGFNMPIKKPVNKFPGFSEKQIQQLYKDTANVPIEKRAEVQYQLYKEILPQLKTNDIKDKRIEAKANIYNDSLEERDIAKRNILQAQLRMEDLADQVKDKFNLIPTAPTNEVLEGFSRMLADQQVDPKLAEDYLNGRSEELLYVSGLKERPMEEVKEKKSIFENVVGAAAESTSGVAEFAGTSLAKGIGRISKKLGADETKVNQLVDSYVKSWDTLGGEDIGDEDSLVYQGAKMLFDIAQVATPGGLARGAAKGTQVAGKGAKAVEGLGKISKNWTKIADDIAIGGENILLKAGMKPKAAEKAAQLTSKVLSKAGEGALDMVMFDVIAEGELPNLKEVGLGAAIGGALPIAGAGLSAARRGLAKVAPKLELSGLLNPAKLTSVKEKLIEEGTEAMGKGKSSDVGKWMIERNIKGNKTEIIEQLIKHSDESKGIVDGLLGSSTTKHNIPSAKNALNNLYKDIKNIPGLEGKADDISKLLKKDTYTLSELNKIKRELDDVYTLYTRAGGESAGLKSQGLRNIRADLRKYIEKQATEEGLGNIKMLNNETSISRTLADAISKKDSGDLSREILSIFAKGTLGGITGTQVGPFKGDGWLPKIGNFIVGAIVGKYLLSTKTKTYVANSLRKLSGFEKKEIDRFIQSKGKEALSVKTLNKIDEIREGAKTLSTKKTNNVDNMIGGNNSNFGDGVGIINTSDDIMKQTTTQLKAPKVTVSDNLINEAKKYKTFKQYTDYLDKNKIRFDEIAKENRNGEGSFTKYLKQIREKANKN